ncbi:MAG TPA: histidine ammonia-lyase [Candidatus Acidoferrales bacterium]|nr:histidine ammonia-lyase [Candidatus Acidoferrales bacterium]
MSAAKILLDGNFLTFEQVYEVALRGEIVGIAGQAGERMSASRAIVERLIASDATAYGVNTGFGELAEVRISREQIRQLQLNLVRSHACGVGAPLDEAETRAMMLLRANALAKGYSGVRPVVVETLCAMLNSRVHPVIPCQGSVGASGDLAPLAHLAHVAIGEGEAVYQGARVSGAEAMKSAGIPPLELEAKEGLSLLNGTQGMLALLCLALRDAQIAIDSADVAATLSLDALRGSPAAFDARIVQARPHAGAIATATNLERLNNGSEIRESHRAAENDPRVQDAYSLRCTPQVHGAVRDALAQIREVLAIELNSATDNPLVFGDSGAGEILSGGNFHGQPLAMAADQMAVAFATLAGISERRIAQMTNPQTSLLPAFLTKQPGLNSGFMILQVAAAGIASETKTQAAPHSIDSIPTSADQEDYVSMGMAAARRLKPMLENLRRVLSIELLAAAQGIDLLAPLKTGREAQRAQALVRSVSPTVDQDRSLSADIEKVAELIKHGEFSKLIGS